MKPVQIVLFVVALMGVMAVFIFRGEKEEAPIVAAVEAAGEEEKNSRTGSRNSADTATNASPETFFLEEGSAEDISKRKVSNRTPKVTGSRTIGEQRRITSASEGDFMAPRWSPDGLELLFSRGGYNGLYARGLNGGEIAQITDKAGIGYGAEWKKDGRIRTRGADGEIQEFNADGSPADDIAIETDATRVGSFNKDDVVYVRKAPGEAPQPVSASGDDKYYGGKLSPDGKYIVYNGLQTGVYIEPLDGSSPPVNIGEGANPTWLPDSSGVVFAVTEDDGHNLVAGDLYLASRDGSDISNLTGGSPAIETNPTVSPDGNYIAYERDGEIFVGTLR